MPRGVAMGILCPGQGGQSWEALASWRLHPEVGPEVVRLESGLLARHPGLRSEWTRQEASDNRVAQPLVVLLGLAWWAAWQKGAGRGQACPRLLLGLSVGHVTSMAIGGLLTEEEALDLAVARGEIFAQEAPPGWMLAGLRGGAPSLPPDLLPSIHWAPDRWTAAIPLERPSALGHDLQADGRVLEPLGVTVPSHTSLMARAQARLSDWLAPWMKEPDRRLPMGVRLLSGLTGAPLRGRRQALEDLARQTSTPLRLDLALQQVLESGLGCALELPPGSGLAGMLHAEGLSARQVRDFRSLEGVRGFLNAGAG